MATLTEWEVACVRFLEETDQFPLENVQADVLAFLTHALCKAGIPIPVLSSRFRLNFSRFSRVNRP